RPISSELESAVLLCLEKNRSKRPQTARDLSNLLDRAPTARAWTRDEADTWWLNHDRSIAAAASKRALATTSPPRALPPQPAPGNTIAATTVTAILASAPGDNSAAKTSPTGLDKTIATDANAEMRD